MLKIYTKTTEAIWNPEMFFDANIDWFMKRGSDLGRVGSYVITDEGACITPLYRIELKHLPTSVKLILCMREFPLKLFELPDLPDSVCITVLKANDGRLYIKRTKPFEYFFTLDACVDDIIHINSSTELNILLARRNRIA